MKRLFAVLLCLCLAMTGCQKYTGKENKDIHAKTEETEQSETNNQSSTTDQPNNNSKNSENADANKGKSQASNDKETGENTAALLLKLDKEWTRISTAENEKEELVVPEYEAKVKPYTIAKDLSNIKNISQFTGFTKEQKNSIAKNGFVVLPGQSTRMYYVYDENEYKGVPNFITSDSMLHTYHQFYDKSLAVIETSYLYKDLDLLTSQMLDKSIQLLEALKEDDLKALQEKNIIYFMVARMLILNSSDLSAPANTAASMNQSDYQKMIAMAVSEFELINKAEGYTESPLFGDDFDYSQFKVRGHYTRSEELGKYFKTMMWLGTGPVPFYNNKGEYQYENTLQSLLMTFTTFLEAGSDCSAKQWTDIYQPTSQYVGLSDDIDVFTMNNLRKSVFGDNEDPNIFNNDNYYDKLKEAVDALPEPKIQGKLVVLSAPTGKQFRYMGQRYILDSYILQGLIDSIKRPIPSALDVMGVMGSNTAEDLLFNYYKPQNEWPEYEAKYNELKKEVAGYGNDLWNNNLYNGWLWSIKEELTEFASSSGMPFFMTTDAWKKKSLNAALGSYTELKHDTVLYGKQGVAEGGGYRVADYHYVEPNVTLYCKLLYLTDNTTKVLEERGMLTANLKEAAEMYKELLNILITCSIKELKNEMLTEDEYKHLLWVGGSIEAIAMELLEGITGDMAYVDLSDMLVSDITTNQNTYLSLGTGYFDQIYVVVPVGDKLYLSRGPVYSYYEFVSDTRLTDEEWWALQGIKITHEDYGDFPEFTEPSKNLPKQPEWIKTFKKGTNNVTIQGLEAEW